MSLAATGIAEVALGAQAAALPIKGKPAPKTRTLVAKPSRRLAPEAR